MNIKIYKVPIIGILVILVITTSMTMPLAVAQTNQTGEIEEKLKTAAEENAMKATAPGDTVFVLICPQNFQSIDECQIFVGQPA